MMTNTKIDKLTSSEDQRTTEFTSSAPAPVTRTPGTLEKGKMRPQKSPLESVGNLLRTVYLGTFKRVTLKRVELAAIQSGPSLGSSERDELHALALSDRMLDKTRQLMLIGTAADGLEVADQLIEFAREVLRSYPAFRVGSLTGVLENLPDAVKEDRAVQIITSQNYASLPWGESSKPLTKRELDRCRANALNCLLLLFWAKRRTSVERIHYYLQTSLWAATARRYKTEAEKFGALIKINARDSVAAAITYGLLEKQALEQSQRVEAACMAHARAAAQASKLEEELTNIEKRLSATQEKLDWLTKEHHDAVQAHENAKAHWEDEFEQLRGQVLRRLTDELSLLDDGLHALTRDPPKVHVMVDHAERAIDGLKSEMKRLREKG